MDELTSLQASNGFALGELNEGPGPLREPATRITQLAGMRPLSAVFSGLATDNHPPLYFVVLRPWRTLFGDGEAATRSLAVLFSLLSVGLWWRVVRRRNGAAAALWVVALLAVSGGQLRAAQQVRGYSLAMAAVALAVLAVSRLEAGARPRTWVPVLGFAACAALLTHYYAAGALAGLGLYALAAQRGALRRASVGGLLAGALLFLVAWGPTALEQRQSVMGNNQWVMEGTEGHGLRTLERLIRLPLAGLQDFREGHPPPLALGGLAWLALVAAAALRPGARLYAAMFLGAAALVAGVDLGLHSAQLATLRYTVFGTTALAATFACLDSGRARLVPAAALLLAVVGLPRAYEPQGPAWREFAHMVDGLVRPHEPVVVLSEPPLREGYWAYQALRHYAWSPVRPFVLLTRQPGAGLSAALRGRGSAWILTYAPGEPVSPVPGMRVAERIAWSLEMPTLLRLQAEP